jgi:D-amino-acid oxidase
MQIASFNFYHKLTHNKDSSETGVQRYPTTEYFDSSSATSASADELNLWYQKLLPDFKIIPEEQLPRDAGVTSGVKYTSLAVNPNIFLPYLQRELEKVGTKFIRAEIRDLQHARSLTSTPPRLIINASGVGAKVIANDDAVLPVRGQTMFVKTDYAECLMREGSEYTYIIPRAHSGGVIIGGVKHPGRTDTNVDEHVREDVLRRVNALSGGVFKDLDLVEGRTNGDVVDIVGFRPGRKEGLRVELDTGEGVVHAYGSGGAGYIYSFGIAERVGQLVARATEHVKAQL